VPLALAMLCASNPKVSILDTLSKLSHDSDLQVAQNSILGMGIVGAGTNNARVATMLRQLASFYHKEAGTLFLVRIAQGLLHMAKGTCSISPYHADRSLLSPAGVSGLLAVLVGALDMKTGKLLSPLSGVQHLLTFSIAVSVTLLAVLFGAIDAAADAHDF
jgi:26S proteasome regulatory subunit N1